MHRSITKDAIQIEKWKGCDVFDKNSCKRFSITSWSLYDKKEELFNFAAIDCR